jgi:aryl-alcohol dehydrogenase-like predicted oxidoreductase
MGTLVHRAATGQQLLHRATAFRPVHAAWHCSDAAGCAPPLVQVQFSLLSIGTDQAAVKATADDLGVTLISYSPLALGLLTGRLGAAGLLPGWTAGRAGTVVRNERLARFAWHAAS